MFLEHLLLSILSLSTIAVVSRVVISLQSPISIQRFGWVGQWRRRGGGEVRAGRPHLRRVSTQGTLGVRVGIWSRGAQGNGRGVEGLRKLVL